MLVHEVQCDPVWQRYDGQPKHELYYKLTPLLYDTIRLDNNMSHTVYLLFKLFSSLQD